MENFKNDRSVSCHLKGRVKFMFFSVSCLAALQIVQTIFLIIFYDEMNTLEADYFALEEVEFVDQSDVRPKDFVMMSEDADLLFGGISMGSQFKTSRQKRYAGVPEGSGDAEDWMWMSSSARIPTKAIKSYCQETKNYCVASGPPGLPGPNGDKGDKGTDGITTFLKTLGASELEALRGPPGLPGQPGLDGVPGLPGAKGDKVRYPLIALSGTNIVFRGQSIHLFCDTIDPDWTDFYIDWFKDGRRIIDNDRLVITDYHLVEKPLLVSELLINRSQDADAGLYVCRSAKGRLESIKVNVFAGIPGVIGSFDEKPRVSGTRAFRGHPGLPGIAGPKGERGDKGDNGIPSLTTLGASELQALRGPTGLPGRVGGIGLDGQPGAPGPKGTQGDVGHPGQKGHQGEKGIIGMSGRPGTDGLEGLIGMKGMPGETGLPGLKGANGEKGEPEFCLVQCKESTETTPTPSLTTPQNPSDEEGPEPV